MSRKIFVKRHKRKKPSGGFAVVKRHQRTVQGTGKPRMFQFGAGGHPELVSLVEAKKEVYDEGFSEGKDIAELTDADTTDEAYEAFQDSFPQSSEYANSVLPRLRELAGFRDSGRMGTFTDGGEEEQYNYDELHEKYWEGVSDGLERHFKKKKR